jgi:hypothetical protein
MRKLAGSGRPINRKRGEIAKNAPDELLMHEALDATESFKTCYFGLIRVMERDSDSSGKRIRSVANTAGFTVR